MPYDDVLRYPPSILLLKEQSLCVQFFIRHQLNTVPHSATAGAPLKATGRDTVHSQQKLVPSVMPSYGEMVQDDDGPLN